MSEAPYVLDGLHHHTHQTDLRIAEHFTDTAGATDHVFGLCHLLGYRFAPWIKDLKDRKLYTIEKPNTIHYLSWYWIDRQADGQAGGDPLQVIEQPRRTWC